MALPAFLLAGCAGAADPGQPLADPVAAAAEARERSGPGDPARLIFDWQYADERGPVRGEGVLRYNPPDSLRLDLFGAGGGSMAVSLTEAGLRSLGSIEDVRLPPATFLYATAGIFRPEAEGPRDGRRRDGEEVLVYGRNGTVREYRFRDGLLWGVEERSDGRRIRRLEVRWEDGRAWPAGAEYRDDEIGSRVRWTLEEARPVPENFPREIYDLPSSP